MKQIYEFKQQTMRGVVHVHLQTHKHTYRHSQHQQQLIPASVCSKDIISIFQLCDPANLQVAALPVAKKAVEFSTQNTHKVNPCGSQKCIRGK